MEKLGLHRCYFVGTQSIYLSLQKEILEHGINLFNKKPRAGLDYLQQHGLLATDIRSVAEFLHKDDDRLDRTVIGDYLGDPDDFNRAVMYQYVDLLDFTGKDLVQALRYSICFESTVVKYTITVHIHNSVTDVIS